MSNIATQTNAVVQRHYIYATGIFIFAAFVQIVFLPNSVIPFLQYKIGINPYLLPLILQELLLLVFLVLIESYVFWRAGLLSITGFPFSSVFLAVTIADCAAHIAKAAFQAAFMGKWMLLGPDLPGPEGKQMLVSFMLLILVIIVVKTVGYLIPLRDYGAWHIVRIGFAVNIIIIVGMFILGSASGHLSSWLLL